VRRLAGTGIRVEVSPPTRDDYLGQQVTKLHADEYLATDLIVHVDSDVIVTSPTTPADLCDGDLPRVVRRPVATLGRHRPWVAPTQRFLGWPPEWDYMQQPPFTYPRALYGEVREHCLRVHGRPLADYVLGCGPRGFSEFNVLGAWAQRHQAPAFSWRSWNDPALRPRWRWYWSRDGIDAARRAELAQLTTRDQEVGSPHNAEVR
jgi:hypothetical protein